MRNPAVPTSSGRGFPSALPCRPIVSRLARHSAHWARCVSSSSRSVDLSPTWVLSGTSAPHDPGQDLDGKHSAVHSAHSPEPASTPFASAATPEPDTSAARADNDISLPGPEASWSGEHAAGPPSGVPLHEEQAATIPDEAEASPSQSTASPSAEHSAAATSSSEPPDSPASPTPPEPPPASPPPTAAPPAPAASRSYYYWPRVKFHKERPRFLDKYGVPEDQGSNVISFLGHLEPYQGKFFVSSKDYAEFLSEYLAAYNGGYLLFLAERYLHHPFRYFAELDFSWDLDLALVESVTPEVIDIVTRTAQEFFRSPELPQCLVSMRTPYKVHLNFPTLITTELLAHMCRDRIVARCKEQLGTGAGGATGTAAAGGTAPAPLTEGHGEEAAPSGTVGEEEPQQGRGHLRHSNESCSGGGDGAHAPDGGDGTHAPDAAASPAPPAPSSAAAAAAPQPQRHPGAGSLDWERVVDFPHGSFRMLGSRKAKHMDFDPPWVGDKAYYPVTWDTARGAWKMCGVHYRLLCASSIFPDARQLREFERSPLFREMAYADAEAYHAKIEERQRRRNEQRAAAGLPPIMPPAPPRAGTGPTAKSDDPLRIRMFVRDDGLVGLRMYQRKWSLRADAEIRRASGARGATGGRRGSQEGQGRRSEQHSDEEES